MSDIDSDADSISDSSNAHSDDSDDDDNDGGVGGGVGGGGGIGDQLIHRDLCDWVRANDPRILNHNSVFELIRHIGGCSEAEFITVLQALKENTSVKHIDFNMLFESHMFTERSTLVTAEYLESTKTLQVLDFGYAFYLYPREVGETVSCLLRALSRNTSVTKLIIMDYGGVSLDSVAFQEVLTRTQTLQKLAIIGPGYRASNRGQIAAIASGFANNTTLRDIEFNSWLEAELAPVLTALHCHPALQKIHFGAKSVDYLPSLSGLEVLLRSQDSKVKELIFEQVDTTRTVGLHPVMQELARNTRVTDLSILDSVLSRENVQQVTAVLRHNTALQYLNLRSSALGIAGLVEIAPVLYGNTSIKTLDLSNNGLDDIESTNVLRELLRRNKTIASLCIGGNAFGRDIAAVRSIFEGLRSNTALQHLDLIYCQLGDQDISVLANALAARNAGTLELDLHCNGITSVGVRALVDDNVEAMKTVTKLCLSGNLIRSEGATILADALGHYAMPNLKELRLGSCGIDDDGCMALVSALEQNTSLRFLDLKGNSFHKRGFMALAESLPIIKGLQQLDFTEMENFESILPLLLEGFRKNHSLVKVGIKIAGRVYEHVYAGDAGEWSQELKFLGRRNRFTPLLKASDPPDAFPKLGIWSRALAKVAAEPDLLFHVLHNKPKLVGSAGGGSKKRNRDDDE
jgi:Ran GTPase-activating protein (RanGAP) involved in mRNA processing and transport